VFVSSVHYGLEDLRGELASFLESLGVLPFVSSEGGFPDNPRLSPYVQCLKVLEQTLIVLAIVDRRYGSRQTDWSPYEQYAGLSPTHAEIRHSIALKKRLLVYYRSEIEGFHSMYSLNKEKFGALNLPQNLDLETLDMFGEIREQNPAPWMESFRDVRDIKESIRKKLLEDLYVALSRREALAHVGAEFLLESALKSDPDLLRRVLFVIAEMPPEKRESLTDYLDELIERPLPKEPAAHAIPGRRLRGLVYAAALAA